MPKLEERFLDGQAAITRCSYFRPAPSGFFFSPLLISLGGDLILRHFFFFLPAPLHCPVCPSHWRRGPAREKWLFGKGM